MIFIGKYDEFAPNMGFPSVRDCIGTEPHPYKDLILEYMKSGDTHMVSPGLIRDVITGQFAVPYTTRVHMNDGTYSWTNAYVYHVGRYNLAVPEDFVCHIMARRKQDV